MRRPMGVLALLTIALASCGTPPTTDGPTAAPSVDACSLATPEEVATAFGGRSSVGAFFDEGYCSYRLTGGSVNEVDIWYYGDASRWEHVRAQFGDAAELTDVAGIGDAAFYPSDRGASLLIVSADGIVYAVDAGIPDTPLPDAIDAAVADLAATIAGS